MLVSLINNVTFAYKFHVFSTFNNHIRTVIDSLMFKYELLTTPVLSSLVLKVRVSAAICHLQGRVCYIRSIHRHLEHLLLRGERIVRIAINTVVWVNRLCCPCRIALISCRLLIFRLRTSNKRDMCGSFVAECFI